MSKQKDLIIRIKEYNDEEIRSTKERAKTEYELNLASRMQASMLPPSIPVINGYAIAASMNPAAYVAGDFYDLFMTDETHLVLVVADVTGKGVHAALLAAFAQTSIKYNTRSDIRPSEILSRLNQEICDKDLDGIFVYTDGVTDAVNKEGKRFGTENLKNVLNAKPDMQPEEILAEVRHSVMESFSNVITLIIKAG